MSLKTKTNILPMPLKAMMAKKDRTKTQSKENNPISNYPKVYALKSDDGERSRHWNQELILLYEPPQKVNRSWKTN